MTGITPRHVSACYPVRLRQDAVEIGGFFFKSRDLRENLAGCGRVLLFAATLGVEADALLRHWAKKDISRCAALNAEALSFLAEYADGSLRAAITDAGGAPRAPFIPGCGDFSLEQQRPLLALLNAGRRIGLTLTAAGMLTPEKSVTALVGLDAVAANDAAAAAGTHPCSLQNCAACKSPGCAFRKSDTNENS